MHVELFLHKTLSPVMHLKRLATLKLLVSAALVDKKISVTGLGRAIKGEASERSYIRRSDRFIGNRNVLAERKAIYGALIKKTVGTRQRPHLIVDWSHIPNSTHYVLRAALAMSGRALTLYEEVHPKLKEGNAVVHQQFLKQLKLLLPTDCQPIIITDAGFHNPWFKEVIALGWDYLGRIRGAKTFQKFGESTWEKCSLLFNKATSVAQYIDEVKLCQTSSLTTHFYLHKRPAKGRISLNKLKKKSHYKKDYEHGASAKEPWLLATSLTGGEKIIKQVFSLYVERMQIEEGFRDLKSSAYGFSFEKAQSKKIERIEVLLLIAALASLIAWLTGLVAEKQHWHYHFQANSTKNTRVLSLFFLGCRLIKKKINIPINVFEETIKNCYELFPCTI
jgi:hypothetical protein